MKGFLLLLSALVLTGCGTVRLEVETNNLGPFIAVPLMKAAQRGGATLCGGKRVVREERELQVELHSPDPQYRHPVPGMEERSRARFVLECTP